jgi:hypothetical protein
MNENELRRVLDAVDWSRAKSALGQSDFVPGAFLGLVLSRSETEAEQHYWELDNGIVRQGALFEAAGQLAPAILGALELPLSHPARFWLVELLTELVLGETDPSETARGVDVRAIVRDLVRGRLPMIVGLLQDPDARVRKDAIYLLDALDADRRRFYQTVESLARDDPDSGVRQEAQARAKRRVRK